MWEDQDTTGSVGDYSSITIGADSLPIISYYDASNGDLKSPIAPTRFARPSAAAADAQR